MCFLSRCVAQVGLELTPAVQELCEENCILLVYDVVPHESPSLGGRGQLPQGWFSEMVWEVAHHRLFEPIHNPLSPLLQAQQSNPMSKTPRHIMCKVSLSLSLSPFPPSCVGCIPSQVAHPLPLFLLPLSRQLQPLPLAANRFMSLKPPIPVDSWIPFQWKVYACVCLRVSLRMTPPFLCS